MDRGLHSFLVSSRPELPPDDELRLPSPAKGLLITDDRKDWLFPSEEVLLDTLEVVEAADVSDGIDARKFCSALTGMKMPVCPPPRACCRWLCCCTSNDWAPADRLAVEEMEVVEMVLGMLPVEQLDVILDVAEGSKGDAECPTPPWGGCRPF